MNRTRFFSTVSLLLMIPAMAFAKPEKHMALVIGNTLYAAAPLISPANDADTIAKALEKCNFTVTKKLNLDRENMERALSEFQQALRSGGGVGYFYFAGNGFQVNGENYLAPIDADPKVEKDATSGSILVSSILKTMKDAGNRINIVVLDAAYASPFGDSFQLKKAGFAEMQAPDGFVIISAAQPDTVVEDKSGRKSPFTADLSQSLTTPDLELMESFEQVSKEIVKSSLEKQEPWMSASVLEPIYLFYPKLDFFNLLADIKRFRKFSETTWADKTKSGFQTRSEIEVAWQSLLKFYPRWRSKLDSKDPTDLIIAALNEDLDGDLFKMTQLFNVSLKKTNTLGMDFVYIPPGKFVMGSPFDEPGRGKDENQKQITISQGFFMQITEVTQAQWMAVMERNLSNFDECGSDCPVESVSWQDANTFIKRLNALEETESYRLPKEAEWEYATRTGEPGWFCFGSDHSKFPEYAWYKGNSQGRPHPVARKKPNQWGLYDVHGNVWEWCQDREGDYRLARGGSWFYPMLFARSANRFFIFPKDRNYTVGFRLVKTP